ncbi:MAG: tetratricopeptide repeat protein, partial [Planctomycetia bacterium]|nr:tetratricopeptide repeat protein [Planctomycetia bacterium]
NGRMKRMWVAWIFLGISGGLIGCGEEPEPDLPPVTPETIRVPGDPELFSPSDPVDMVHYDERSDELAEDVAERAGDAARTRYAVDFVAGKVHPKDPEKVLGWLRTAAESGESEARKGYASHMIRFGTPEQKRQALIWCRELAETGDVESMLLVARCTLLGDAGAVRSVAGAAEWTRRAAEKGDPFAQYCYGVYCQTGSFPIGESSQLAAELLYERKNGTENGDDGSLPDGEFPRNDEGNESDGHNEGGGNDDGNRGTGVDGGRGDTDGTGADRVDQTETVIVDTPMVPDMKEAAHWFRRAAEQEFVPAQVALGLLYMRDRSEGRVGNGRSADGEIADGDGESGSESQNGVEDEGVERNPEEGLRWLRRAAENGDLSAQYFVGQCSLNGIGTDRNPRDGAQWMERAAENGHPGAMESLGTLYQSGTGVEKNEKTAVEWLRRAADQGRERAAFLLGMCYQEGTGVSPDPDEALQWFRFAASRGDRMAGNMVKILEDPGE